MSIDRIACCFLGFEVDSDKLYESKEVELDPLPNCEHGYPGKLKGKHCIECGTPIHTKKRVELVTQLKDEIVKAVLPKYRDFGNVEDGEENALFSGHGYVLGKVDGVEITMFQVEFEGPFVVAGVHLASIDAMHDGVNNEKAQWVNEKRLATFLKKKKIPFKKGTFLIHMLMEYC